MYVFRYVATIAEERVITPLHLAVCTDVRDLVAALTSRTRRNE